MANVFSSAANHLTAAIEGNASVAASYSQLVALGPPAVYATGTLNLVPAQVQFLELDDQSLNESYQGQDFICRASKLFLAAVIPYTTGIYLPKRGDRITYSLGGETLIYEVRSPQNLPVYELDSTRQKLRIHAVRVQ